MIFATKCVAQSLPTGQSQVGVRFPNGHVWAAVGQITLTGTPRLGTCLVRGSGSQCDSLSRWLGRRSQRSPASQSYAPVCVSLFSQADWDGRPPRAPAFDHSMLPLFFIPETKCSCFCTLFHVGTGTSLLQRLVNELQGSFAPLNKPMPCFPKFHQHI